MYKHSKHILFKSSLYILLTEFSFDPKPSHKGTKLHKMYVKRIYKYFCIKAG